MDYDILAGALATAYEKISQLGFEMEEQASNAADFAENTFANRRRQIDWFHSARTR